MKVLVLRLFCIFGFIIFFNNNAIAQKPSIVLSPEIEIPKGYDFSKHEYSDMDGHYVSYRKNRAKDPPAILLQKYDDKFRIIFNKELKLSDKNQVTMRFTSLKEKFLWVTRLNDKKTDIATYKGRLINRDGVVEPPKDLFSYKFDRNTPYDLVESTSKDSTLFAYCKTLDDDDNDDNSELYISVFDDQLNKKWEKKLHFPIENRKFSVLNFILTNDGSIFLLTRIDEFKGKKNIAIEDGEWKQAFKIKLYHLRSTDTTPKEFNIQLPDDLIKEVSISLNPSGDLVLGGMYTAMKSKLLKGIFYMKIKNADDSILFVKKKDFTSEQLAKMGDDVTDKNWKKEEGVDSRFNFENILFFKDGSFSMIAEEKYEIVTTVSNGKTTTTSTTYYAKDILCMNVDVSGEIKSITTIPKRQKMRLPNYLYHSAMEMENGIAFFYNEDEKNLAKDINLHEKLKYVTSMHDCASVVTVLDKDGKLTRSQLFNSQEVKTLMMPSECKSIGNSAMFILGSKTLSIKMNKLRFGIVRF